MLRFCSIVSARNPRERIEALYECLAPFYALLHPFVRAVAGKAVALLPYGHGMSALDVCTGTGVVAEALASRGYRVTGIDIAFSMLLQRRKARRAADIANLRMDARHLAFADNAFDVCAVSMGLHEFSEADRRLIIREMSRVTRRYILVADYSGRQSWIVRFAESLEASHYEDFTDGSLAAQLTRMGLRVASQGRWYSVGLYLCEIDAVSSGSKTTPVNQGPSR